MGTSRPKHHARRGSLAAVAVAATVLVGCGNVIEQTESAKKDDSRVGTGTSTPGGVASNPSGRFDLAALTQNNPSSEPGVTADTIKVGGVAAKTNILQLPIDQAFNGTQAYFDMVNAQGGIWGRKLELVSKRDDQMMKNKEEAQGLVSDDIFAVAPVATFLFTGATTLGDSGIPTFGWNIQKDWAGPMNLFGEKGSYLCTDCAYPTQPFIARELGAEKVGLLAYGVDQSAQCAAGVKKSFEKYPTAKVVYTDDTIPYGSTDYGVQVQKMKDEGVELITTCMDQGGVINLARELSKQGVKIPQYMQQGYDYDIVEKFGAEFEGSVVLTQFSTLEFEPKPPGLENYDEWISKIPDARKGELSLAGWLAADMLVRGIALAGPDFTRDSVVDSLNQLTDWTAGGIAAGWDWTIVHETDMPTTCVTFSKIEAGRFVPAYTEPGKPFVCFEKAAAEIPANPPRKASTPS